MKSPGRLPSYMHRSCKRGRNKSLSSAYVTGKAPVRFDGALAVCISCYLNSGTFCPEVGFTVPPLREDTAIKCGCNGTFKLDAFHCCCHEWLLHPSEGTVAISGFLNHQDRSENTNRSRGCSEMTHWNTPPTATLGCGFLFSSTSVYRESSIESLDYQPCRL